VRRGAKEEENRDAPRLTAPASRTRESGRSTPHGSRLTYRRGEPVCIFPEGQITRTSEIDEFQRGFLAIRKNTGAPVIPINLGGLWGSIFSYERGKLFWKWPRSWPYRVPIRVGPPITEPADAEQVRQAVAHLGRSEPNESNT